MDDLVLFGKLSSLRIATDTQEATENDLKALTELRIADVIFQVPEQVVHDANAGESTANEELNQGRVMIYFIL